MRLFYVTSLLHAVANSCVAPADCSAAGACVAGVCRCEVGFMGPTCNALDNRTSIPLDSGFRLAGWHVWGSQVVMGDDGLFHMAASIYPAEFDFYEQWLFTAQIAHATSTTALGPYTFESVILPYGEDSAWDRSVMNPKLFRAPNGGPWLLYYVGSSYAGPTPGGKVPLPKNSSAAQASQRIGLATAPAPGGPYVRGRAPVLEPRAGAWDERMVSNPAVCAYGNGSSALLMVYKGSSPAGAGTTQTRVCFGVAAAPSWDAPFVRLSDDPILPCPQNTFRAEDPTLWRDSNGFFHLIFKDFSGFYTRAGYSGAHAISKDGVIWSMTDPSLAYTTTHTWSDGVTRKQQQQERAQILLDESGDGQPLAVFFATNTALNGSSEFWNMAMPLRPL